MGSLKQVVTQRIVLSHPTGNANVRAVLKGLSDSNWLDSFHTTVAFQPDNWLVRMSPLRLRQWLLRRSYVMDCPKLHLHPWREMARLASSHLRCGVLTQHESGWACIDKVCADLDRRVAAYVGQTLSQTSANHADRLTAVYCYEDSSVETFKTAKEFGLKCIYDLPIPYCATTIQLLREEAERLPAWEPTLGGTRDSDQKLSRKRREIELADLIICNSRFTYSSIPAEIRAGKKCVVAEYGIPDVPAQRQSKQTGGGKLRILFVGSMTQRKGLADLFAAMTSLGRRDIELVVLGTPIVPMEFYRNAYPDFVYEPPRPHQQVLELMMSCDVFVFPSIVEGRGLVQLEAMACGLPLISTINATGDDLVDEGKNGFIVPIRSPEAIAAKLVWCDDNREKLVEMGHYSRRKISTWSWDSYRRTVLQAIAEVHSDVGTRGPAESNE